MQACFSDFSPMHRPFSAPGRRGTGGQDRQASRFCWCPASAILGFVLVYASTRSLATDPPDRSAARGFLVGTPGRFRRSHQRHNPCRPARRGDRVLGVCEHVWPLRLLRPSGTAHSCRSAGPLLCLVAAVLAVGMFAIAFSISDRSTARSWTLPGFFSGGLVEKDVYVLAITLFLYSFGYGGITKFFVSLYAQESGVGFRGVYFVAFTVTVLLTRPYVVRRGRPERRNEDPAPAPWTDGHRVRHSCHFGPPAVPLVASAVVFGTGFGSAYPVFASYMLRKIDPARRGAAFGSIILAFDTGIGSGSMLLGIIIEHHGYRPAFTLASLLAACSIPYFLLARRALPRFR